MGDNSLNDGGHIKGGGGINSGIAMGRGENTAELGAAEGGTVTITPLNIITHVCDII